MTRIIDCSWVGAGSKVFLLFNVWGLGFPKMMDQISLAFWRDAVALNLARR